MPAFSHPFACFCICLLFALHMLCSTLRRRVFRFFPPVRQPIQPTATGVLASGQEKKKKKKATLVGFGTVTCLALHSPIVRPRRAPRRAARPTAGGRRTRKKKKKGRKRRSACNFERRAASAARERNPAGRARRARPASETGCGCPVRERAERAVVIGWSTPAYAARASPSVPSEFLLPPLLLLLPPPPPPRRATGEKRKREQQQQRRCLWLAGLVARIFPSHQTTAVMALR